MNEDLNRIDNTESDYPIYSLVDLIVVLKTNGIEVTEEIQKLPAMLTDKVMRIATERINQKNEHPNF